MNFSSDPINTQENLIAKNKTKSISIYLVLVLAILIFLALLPVIKIDISRLSRGIVRSTTDNVPLTSLVNGKVIFVKLKNNQMVQQGATLLEPTPKNLVTEKDTNQDFSSIVQDQVHHFLLALLVKNNTLKMVNNNIKACITDFCLPLIHITIQFFSIKYILISAEFPELQHGIP